MASARTQQDAEILRKVALPFSPSDQLHRDTKTHLMNSIGDSKLVLIGEASHGTHEFYQLRAQLTQDLIVNKGIKAVVVEGDFPDCYRVNRFVRGLSTDATAEQALSDFHRFPKWMWRNTVVLDFIKWLKAHNDQFTDQADKTGFYGCDLYSFLASAEEVISQLEKIDPKTAEAVREEYSCFEQFGDDTQTYGMAAALGMHKGCTQEALRVLNDMQKRLDTKLQTTGGGILQTDAEFYGYMNARVVKDAEEYYRQCFASRDQSWNVRDKHQAETILHLQKYLGDTKVAVWEHNSHLGDARATDRIRIREWNVGQLIREAAGANSFNIGFITYNGMVTCAHNWGEKAERKKVKDGMPNSWEETLHAVGRGGRFILLNREIQKIASAAAAPAWTASSSSGGDGRAQEEIEASQLFSVAEATAARDVLSKTKLERAIGVIYRPETERMSHYFDARLGQQFDAVIHVDHTRALKPLDGPTHQWDSDELHPEKDENMPITYPSGY